MTSIVAFLFLSQTHYTLFILTLLLLLFCKKYFWTRNLIAIFVFYKQYNKILLCSPNHELSKDDNRHSKLYGENTPTPPATEKC